MRLAAVLAAGAVVAAAVLGSRGPSVPGTGVRATLPLHFRDVARDAGAEVRGADAHPFSAPAVKPLPTSDTVSSAAVRFMPVKTSACSTSASRSSTGVGGVLRTNVKDLHLGRGGSIFLIVAALNPTLIWTGLVAFVFIPNEAVN